jgi:hypothetical protein
MERLQCKTDTIVLEKSSLLLAFKIECGERNYEYKLKSIHSDTVLLLVRHSTFIGKRIEFEIYSEYAWAWQ